MEWRISGARSSWSDLGILITFSPVFSISRKIVLGKDQAEITLRGNFWEEYQA